MTTSSLRPLRAAITILALLTVVTGLAYPLAVTAVAQLVFPGQANGSLITANGQVVGSALIGQLFEDPKYLWGRPSAAGAGYDANASSGSNLAPTNGKLVDRVVAEVDRLRAANGDAPIPVELVTTSGSGLDPHISPTAARYQAARVALARGITEADVQRAIDRHTDHPLFGLLGPDTVNVLLVNLDLDGLLG